MGRSSKYLAPGHVSHGKDGDYLEKLCAARDAKCNSVCRMMWELHRELSERLVGIKIMGAENEGD